MKKLCVFCGSNPGNDPAFRQAATESGLFLARNGITLIYGGANVGLMKTLAESALSEHGEVIGIITHLLAKKHLTQKGLSQLITVETMHERKQKMFELADGFVILPGGIGTMEEFFEAYTLLQLNIHAKPIGILNINGYFNPLLEMLDKMISCRMLIPQHKSALIIDTQIDQLYRMMCSFEAPVIDKWIDDIIARS